MTQSAYRKKPEETERHAPVRKIDQPLLAVWPAGYEQGAFRVVSGGVLLTAKGMPTLFLREAERLAALAE
jgi:hypothetical protein